MFVPIRVNEEAGHLDIQPNDITTFSITTLGITIRRQSLKNKFCAWCGNVAIKQGIARTSVVMLNVAAPKMGINEVTHS